MGVLSKYLKQTAHQELLIPELKKFLKQEYRDIKSGKIKNHVPVQEDARLAAECFLERVKEYNHGDANPYKGYVHPSQLGGCMRRTWYGAMDAPDNGEPIAADLLTSHLIFETGTYVHVMFQNLCERAGLLMEREFLILDHDIKVVGHGDGKLKIKEHKPMLEIKTINSRGFASLKEPKEEHKVQATTYMHVEGLEETCFVYLDKDRHNVKEFVYRYNNEYWKTKVKPRIDTLHLSIAQKTPPPREGKSATTFPCSYCEFSKICYDSRSEEYFLQKLKDEEVTPTKKRRIKTTGKVFKRKSA